MEYMQHPNNQDKVWMQLYKTQTWKVKQQKTIGITENLTKVNDA